MYYLVCTRLALSNSQTLIERTYWMVVPQGTCSDGRLGEVVPGLSGRSTTSEMSHYSSSRKIEFDTRVSVLKFNGQHDQQPEHDAESVYNESLLGQWSVMILVSCPTSQRVQPSQYG